MLVWVRWIFTKWLELLSWAFASSSCEILYYHMSCTSLRFTVNISLCQKNTSLIMLFLFMSQWMLCRPQSKQSETVAIMFSSGTSGRSKGVELTHRNYISSVRGYSSCVGENLTRTLVVLPMYHGYGFSVCTLLPLVQGMAVVVLRKFESRTVLTDIQKFQVMHWLPYHRWWKHSWMWRRRRTLTWDHECK